MKYAWWHLTIRSIGVHPIVPNEPVRKDCSARGLCGFNLARRRRAQALAGDGSLALSLRWRIHPGPQVRGIDRGRAAGLEIEEQLHAIGGAAAEHEVREERA